MQLDCTAALIICKYEREVASTSMEGTLEVYNFGISEGCGLFPKTPGVHFRFVTANTYSRRKIRLNGHLAAQLQSPSPQCILSLMFNALFNAPLCFKMSQLMECGQKAGLQKSVWLHNQFL